MAVVDLEAEPVAGVDLDIVVKAGLVAVVGLGIALKSVTVAKVCNHFVDFEAHQYFSVESYCKHLQGKSTYQDPFEAEVRVGVGVGVEV